MLFHIACFDPGRQRGMRNLDQTLGPPIRYSDHVRYDWRSTSASSWNLLDREPLELDSRVAELTMIKISPSQSRQHGPIRLGVRVNPFMRHLQAYRSDPVPMLTRSRVQA